MIIKDGKLVEVDDTDIIDGTFTIPDGVTYIDKFTFGSCGRLEHINIPNSVIQIGDSAFDGCVDLKSIEIPNSVTYIGNAAFECCESLESITLPECIANIGAFTFACCESLESINIPDSVTQIGYAAFSGCMNLTQVSWGDTVYNVKCIDYDCMHILHEKRHGDYTIYKCQFFPEMGDTVWIAEKDGMTACRASMESSIRDVELKLLDNHNKLG